MFGQAAISSNIGAGSKVFVTPLSFVCAASWLATIDNTRYEFL
jgi:hypothetical protein